MLTTTKKLSAPFVIGLGSGLFNAIIIGGPWDFLNALFYPILLGGAGLVYGLFTAPYFEIISTTQTKLRSATWIVTSFISYTLSFWLVLFITPDDVLPILGAIGFATGGALGALILVIGFHRTFSKLSLLQGSITVVAGSLIPLLLFNILQEDIFLSYGLYPTWQAIMTTFLAYWLYANKEQPYNSRG